MHSLSMKEEEREKELERVIREEEERREREVKSIIETKDFRIYELEKELEELNRKMSGR